MRFRVTLLCALVTTACGAPPIEDRESGTCIPHETRCDTSSRMVTCSNDGIGWETSLCAEEEICLGQLPGSRCEALPAGVRTFEQSLESTARLVLPGGGSCTAWLVNETHIGTNNHCCPEEGSCAGAMVQFRFRGGEQSAEDVERRVVADALLSRALDFSVLEIDSPAPIGIRPVVLSPGRDYVQEHVYVVGHPSGRTLESSRGVLFEYVDEVTYNYRSGPKTKLFQFVYWAAAEPGSSGSPVFNVYSNAVVGIHHTGGLRPADFGLTDDETQEFTRLLGATDSQALIEALIEAGIEHEVLEGEFLPATP